MNSLFTTNILLSIITGSIVAVTITLIVLLAHIISISRKVNNIIHAFEQDIFRVRSAVTAIRKKVKKVITGTKK